MCGGVYSASDTRGTDGEFDALVTECDTIEREIVSSCCNMLAGKKKPRAQVYL